MPARNFGGHPYRGRLAWEGGRWHHEVHNGRDGWWWDVGGVWYYYPQAMEGPPTYVSEDFADDVGDPDGPPVGAYAPPPGGYPPPPVAYVPPPPPPDPGASAVGGAIVGGVLGGLLTGRASGAAAGAIVGGATGAIAGAHGGGAARLLSGAGQLLLSLSVGTIRAGRPARLLLSCRILSIGSAPVRASIAVGFGGVAFQDSRPGAIR